MHPQCDPKKAVDVKSLETPPHRDDREDHLILRLQ